MRAQPSACASNTWASSRGDSMPFWTKNCSVHLSRAPIVQTCAAGAGFMVTSYRMFYRLRLSARGQMPGAWPQSADAKPASGEMRLRLPPQPLLLVEFLKRLDQLAYLPRNDGVELVQVQVDAVIGDAVLREVVGANPLAAVAGADQAPPLLG